MFVAEPHMTNKAITHCESASSGPNSNARLAKTSASSPDNWSKRPSRNRPSGPPGLRLSWRDDRTEAVPERPDRSPVGQYRAPLPPTQDPGRAEANVRPQGHRRRGLLPGPDRGGVADAPARLPPLEDRVVLLLHVAGPGGVGAAPRRPPAGHPQAPRPGGDAQCRGRGQPVGEDDGEWRPEGVRRGEKRSPGGSGTCSLTP